MRIVNNADIQVSWFCYNQDDTFKWVALGTGDLEANGGAYDYMPPMNSNNLYFDRFTYRGGGTELAGGTVERAGIITFVGSGGKYHAVVSDG